MAQYKYQTQEFIKKGIDFASIFAQKQEKTRSQLHLAYNLGDVVEFLKVQSDDFKKQDQYLIDLDLGIARIVGQYEVLTEKPKETEKLQVRQPVTAGNPPITEIKPAVAPVSSVEVEAEAVVAEKSDEEQKEEYKALVATLKELLEDEPDNEEYKSLIPTLVELIEDLEADSKKKFADGGTIESNGIKYKEIGGTFFHEQTPISVCNILNEYMHNREKELKLYFGDAETGRDWKEEYDTVGSVGRSTGSIKMPLLIAKKNSSGGGVILDHCIVKIKDWDTGKVLYQHPKYVAPKVEIVPSTTEGYAYETMVDGELHGRHKTLQGATLTKNKIMEDGGSVTENTYAAFYKGREMEVKADTSLHARDKAAGLFKAKKNYDVTVVLTKLGDKEVTHSTAEFAKGGGFDWEVAVGDLVFVKGVGTQGLTGLVVADKDKDGEYEIYFRGLSGTSEFLPVSEFIPIENGHLHYAEKNGDISAYERIAEKEGIKLNPKYKEMLEEEELGAVEHEEYAKGGGVDNGKYKYGRFNVDKDGEHLVHAFRSDDPNLDMTKGDSEGQIIKLIHENAASSHHTKEDEKFTYTKDGVKVDKGTDKYKNHIFYEEDGTAFKCLLYFPNIDDCIYENVETGQHVVGCMDGFYFKKPKKKNKYETTDYEDARTAIESEFSNEKIDVGFSKSDVETLASIIHDMRSEGIEPLDMWESNKVQDYLTNLAAKYKNKKNGGDIEPEADGLWIQHAIKHKGALRRKAIEMKLITKDEKLSVADINKIEKLGKVWAKKAELAKRLMKFKHHTK